MDVSDGVGSSEVVSVVLRVSGDNEVGVLSSSDAGSGLCVGDNIVVDGDGANELVKSPSSESSYSSDSCSDGNGGSGEGGRFTVTGKSLFLNRMSNSIALLLPRVQLITPSPSVWYL